MYQQITDMHDCLHRLIAIPIPQLQTAMDLAVTLENMNLKPADFGRVNVVQIDAAPECEPCEDD